MNTQILQISQDEVQAITSMLQFDGEAKQDIIQFRNLLIDHYNVLE
jgi:predicted flap endonuclease-1-like 5' DNA nuclease